MLAEPDDETDIPDNNEPDITSTDNFRSLFSVCKTLNVTCNVQEDCNGDNVDPDCSSCWLNDNTKNRYCAPPWPHAYKNNNGKAN